MSRGRPGARAGRRCLLWGPAEVPGEGRVGAGTTVTARVEVATIAVVTSCRSVREAWLCGRQPWALLALFPPPPTQGEN